MARLNQTDRNAIVEAFQAQWFKPRYDKLIAKYKAKFSEFAYADVRHKSAVLLEKMIGDVADKDVRIEMSRAISKRSQFSVYIGNDLQGDSRNLWHNLNNGNNHMYVDSAKDLPFYCITTGHTETVRSQDEGYCKLKAAFVKDWNLLSRDWLTKKKELRNALSAIKTDSELEQVMPKAHKLFVKTRTVKFATPAVVADFAKIDSLLEG